MFNFRRILLDLLHYNVLIAMDEHLKITIPENQDPSTGAKFQILSHF